MLEYDQVDPNDHFKGYKLPKDWRGTCTIYKGENAGEADKDEYKFAVAEGDLP
jgi:hypothetical protein